ncbi:MAG: hypothetical protein GY813_13880 [Halieaceae bacterium]|nr:hypothetical protein [Halieaceae bacterium]
MRWAISVTEVREVSGVMKQLAMAIFLCSLSLQALAQEATQAYTSDGRRVMLNTDGTWDYFEVGSSDPGNSAVLRVTEVYEMDDACRVQFQLTNNLGYRISSLVPRLAVHNMDDIVYTERSLSYSAVKPTDSKWKSVQFTGLGCRDISRVVVFDASRCKMGEIDQFNEEKGECLSRIYVEPSDLINIIK